MLTTPKTRIDALTAAGHWGSDTLHSLLASHVEARPQRLAVKDPADREALTGDSPRELTWQALGAASGQLAAQLRAAGIGEGDALIVQLPNVVELLVLYYAVSSLGAVISPVPVQYGRHELQLVGEALGARYVVTLANFRDADLAAVAAEAIPNARVLVFGRELVLDPAGSSRPAVQVSDDANRILSICWTSGTTGTPKGVPRSHNMWLATARASIAAGGMCEQDVLLNPFPLVNMAALGGFLFPAALLGASIILHHPLDPALFLRQMQDEQVTFTIAPPALLNQLAKSPETWRAFDFSALRRIGSGSAPLSPWMIETFERDYGKQVVNFYGSNEGIALFSTPETAPDAAVRAAQFRRPEADGMIDTRVADPDSGEVCHATGERGELLISGATVFDGYHAHDNSTVFTADGYFHSGDLVEICGNAGEYYRIVGRCKDIINRGGMKISPAELDIALEQHPALAEAAVCSYPDERLGEKICVCLVVATGCEVPPLAELCDYLLQQGFAKFKLPERIEVFDALPRNPLGKVQRFELQQRVARMMEDAT
ncbi:MAG: class I adenylate-forming enzyme family protein [Halioglobus sp.]